MPSARDPCELKSKQSLLLSAQPSAAGRGSDGTVEERELAGGGAHGDGDGEVEDRVVVDGRAARLSGAGGRRQHLRLELQELPHEAEVGRDDAAALLDELEGFVQLDAVGAHEVGETNGGGARDPSLTVHKDTSSFVSHRVC